MAEVPTDPRRSFDNAAEVYDEIRPGYPAALFVDLFGLLPRDPFVVEVGPGTGQATKDLLRYGATVHAVELGPSMAAKLVEVVRSERLIVTVDDFEEVEISTQSVDAVFSATAYHWISPKAQLDRPAHMLKPGGVLAVVDLNQVSSPDDEGFFAAAQPIYANFGEAHTGPPVPERNAVVPAIRRRLLDDDRFADVETRSYDWNHTYTAQEYRKLMLSYSGTQMMTSENRRGLLNAIEAFINNNFAGQVTRPILVTLTTALYNR
ncbi:MAG: class I SAM-dependent methyltransferase [Acidimicrobiia bacterium]